ncbi:MAG: aminoacyl-tRNA hydrolase [Bacilli bacterium]|nr:aminoacyl-tRNA hydrolase [Bacilli bacterium]
MKLIVGLGNPGKEYENTRHNMGFFFIDNYAKSKNIEIKTKKFNGLLTEFVDKNEKIILLKPQTYMNLSGESVRKVMDFYKISTDDILIISDDLDLPIGNYRLKSKGSCGGHNGLRNIEQHIDTQNYKRLKIGISKDNEVDTKDYVLSKISKKDKELLELMIPTINEILDNFIDTDFEVLMSKYNHK